MRIAVIGAGGVGGYFGARLAAGGQQVAFVARGDHARAMREHGLQVRSVHGDLHLPEVTVTEDAREVGPCDAVLFCVKSYDTDDAAARHLPHLVAPGSAVVSLQNGVGNLDTIAEVVGRERVVGGLALILATIAEPGVVEHTGGPTRIVFGELDGASSARTQRLLEACEAAGVDARIPRDVNVAMWDKFAFICALAGTTAAVRLPLGEIRDSAASWRLFRRLADETYAVARAEGVAVAPDATERCMSQAEGLEADAYSSLHHDLVTGRRMELDALHGEVLRRADASGVPVPMTEAIHAILSPWAARNGS